MSANPIRPFLKRASTAHRKDPTPYNWGQVLGLNYASWCWEEGDLPATDIATLTREMATNKVHEPYGDGIRAAASLIEWL